MRLIDADALMEKAKQDGAYDYVSAKEIADAPTIDAVRHGQWALKMNERFYWKECSVCGHKPPRSDEYGTYIESEYCPNCGARMDGGGDAE